MKTLLIGLSLLLFSSISLAQDTIRKKDGTLLTGFVREIDSYTLTYVRTDQPEGPLRKISLYEIAEVVYIDGTRELFTVVAPPSSGPVEKPHDWEPGTINQTDKVVIIKRRGPDIHVRPGERFPDIRLYPGERFPDTQKLSPDLVKKLYLDVLTGYAATSALYYNNYYPYTSYKIKPNLSIGVRFGLLKFFDSSEKYKIGLNITMVGFNGLVDNSGTLKVLFAPFNVGFANRFILNENSGIELTPSGGLVISDQFVSTIGFRYGMDVKYRYRRLCFGIDYSGANSFDNYTHEYVNMLSVVFGVKF